MSSSDVTRERGMESLILTVYHDKNSKVIIFEGDNMGCALVPRVGESIKIDKKYFEVTHLDYEYRTGKAHCIKDILVHIYVKPDKKRTE